MHTKQEVFDIVANHLLTQGRRAYKSAEYADVTTVGPEGGCAYRSYDGLKCAVGCLIADEHYDPSLENLRVSHPDVQEALAASGFSVEEGMIRLYNDLQDVHDWQETSEWKSHLRGVAVKHGLEAVT